jgi:hypothetical protein
MFVSVFPIPANSHGQSRLEPLLGDRKVLSPSRSAEFCGSDFPEGVAVSGYAPYPNSICISTYRRDFPDRQQASVVEPNLSVIAWKDGVVWIDDIGRRGKYEIRRKRIWQNVNSKCVTIVECGRLPMIFRDKFNIDDRSCSEITENFWGHRQIAAQFRARSLLLVDSAESQTKRNNSQQDSSESSANLSVQTA